MGNVEKDIEEFPLEIASVQGGNPTVKTARPKWVKTGMKTTKNPMWRMSWQTPKTQNRLPVSLCMNTFSPIHAQFAERLIPQCWNFIM